MYAIGIPMLTEKEGVGAAYWSCNVADHTQWWWWYVSLELSLELVAVAGIVFANANGGGWG